MKAVGAQVLRSVKCRPPPLSSLSAPLLLPRQARRAFRTSTSALSRSDDSNPAAEEKKPDAKQSSDKKLEEEVPAATAKENGNGEAQPQTETPTSATVTNGNGTTLRETLRSQGYGSARARASRARAEEVPPPLELPEWFVDANISLYEGRPIGTTETLAFPLDEKEHESVVQLLERRFDEVALSEREVDWWKQWVTRKEGEELDLEALEEQVEEVVEKARAVHAAAFLQALALLHDRTWHLLRDINLGILKDEGVELEALGLRHLERLRRHHEEKEGEIERYLWWFDKDVPSFGPAQRWLAHIRSDSYPAPGLHLSPLAMRGPSEYPACMELLAAIKSELSVASPGAKQKEIQRPVTVLSVLNRKGISLPLDIIRDIATDLNADVVHLDAASLARILGNYLGQNLHWSRGSISTLGYSAAEINGRLLSRADSDGEHELGMVVTLPSRLRTFLSSKDPSTTIGAFDGRWEDIKLYQALESLVLSADTQRAKSTPNPGSPAAPVQRERDLIIHLHDYVEISSVKENIITKLRHIVDRLWQRGRRVVLVGSSSSDMDKSPQWRDQLVEIGREGNLIIPLHATPGDLYESDDNLVENISNVENMLQAMLGPSTKVEFLHGLGVDLNKYDDIRTAFSVGVRDPQWVYRFASLMIGSKTPRPREFTAVDFIHAWDIMTQSNEHWRQLNPSVRPPYFSPIHSPSRSFTGFMGSDPSEGPFSSAGPPSASGSKDYDQHEKKLLSGLINAKDIHTTFNDIIVPAETKESLIGLTSLSLVRPDAFSYGVLKTERIPGCLLYGPPGTGKTLLAKAVAKESGANMLEVSAASINDMWLGQSEKNVRALFSLARKMAPMVIFLDEADALLGARHNGPGRSGHRETITQFLREWDGLSDMQAFIMVATNRPFDLDEAVLRRLPRKILVDLPLKTERESILKVMLREETLAEDVDVAKLAAETELYSGSDLKNLCVSAAMEAVREEVREKEKWTGEGEYVFPERRVLTRKHFEKGMREISASISEDMESLKAIRKFDEQYGDAGRKRRGKRGMGFEVVEEKKGSEEARVRRVVA